MRSRATWLVLAAVSAVVIASVVDALRGSSSHTEPAHAGLTTTEGIVQTTEGVATTEPVGTTAQVVQSAPPERLPSCTTGQLRLTFTVVDGSASLLLRRVAGKPCHHGRSPIGFTVRDQSGQRVP